MRADDSQMLSYNSDTFVLKWETVDRSPVYS